MNAQMKMYKEELMLPGCDGGRPQESSVTTNANVPEMLHILHNGETSGSVRHQVLCCLQKRKALTTQRESADVAEDNENSLFYHINNMAGSAPINQKMQEWQLCWYGHVL